ncbi:agmatine deiminase family protein [Mucisphaera calidilacus]|uniref:Agmatine deiminase n=1 Tax=Mucisphaera calidilacus TaxID=2527982 RepID=A0A518C154_9BACT|nr:agmatine deiminase family protein [Mucisphaera calidilacus]QDU72949.1 Agmatine deiminase [Mucisphaera calidilacus]
MPPYFEATRDGESAVLRLGPTPAELGYRMPAEWEPQHRIWVTTPTNPDTFPGCLQEAQEQHAEWCGAMSRVVNVRATQSIGIAPEDAWIRDYGPIFLVDDKGGLAFNNYRFNAWGEKYPPWDKMDNVPDIIADFLENEIGKPVPHWKHDMVLEGGSFEVNGVGSLLTTEACLLHPNRNPTLSKQQIEANLAATLGVTNIIWMPRGLKGDDTDGHQDDLARWINTDTIVAIRAPQGHPDHEALEANWRALSDARDQNGHKLNLIELPNVSPAVTYDMPADYEAVRNDNGATTGSSGEHLPASYTNYLIANGHLFLPVFGRPSDDLAIKTYEQAAPHLTIVPIRCEWLIVGRGALHCLSQQEPAVDEMSPLRLD